MVKSWLTVLLRKMLEKAPEACRGVDFPVALQVTGTEPSRWVLSLATGEIDTRTDAEAKATVFVDMNTLNAAARLPRLQPFEQAAQRQTFRVEAEPDQLKKLEALYRALKK